MAQLDLDLMRGIDELHLAYPFAGSRMMKRLLVGEGHGVGRRHVTTLMQCMGIEALYRKPRTTHKDMAHAVPPYLLLVCFQASPLIDRIMSGPWISRISQ